MSSSRKIEKDAMEYISDELIIITLIFMIGFLFFSIAVLVSISAAIGIYVINFIRKRRQREPIHKEWYIYGIIWLSAVIEAVFLMIHTFFSVEILTVLGWGICLSLLIYIALSVINQQRRKRQISLLHSQVIMAVIWGNLLLCILLTFIN